MNTIFQCEIGQVYDQPDHTLLNRWLVLAHPDEPTPTVQGKMYININDNLCITKNQSILDI